MEKIKLLFFGISLMLIQNLMFAGSIFSYDAKGLESTFSNLSVIEQKAINSGSDLSELVQTGAIPSEIAISLTGNDGDKCTQAKQDAAVNYKATGPMVGALCCAGGTNPLFGVLLALIMNNKAPKDENLGITNSSLRSDNEYMDCYRKAAWDKKKKQVWTGVLIGTGIYCVFIIYAISSGTL